MRYLIPFCWVMLASTIAFGQTKIVNGHFMTHENQKVEGRFEIPVQYINAQPVYSLLQWKVAFISTNGRGYEILPGSIQSYTFEYKGKQLQFVSYSNNSPLKNPFSKKNKYIFLNSFVQGELSYVQLTTRTFMPGGFAENGQGGGNGFPQAGNDMKIRYLIKNGEWRYIRYLGWRKDIMTCLKDNPTLYEAVRLKKYQRKDIPTIVAIYNQNAALGIN